MSTPYGRKALVAECAKVRRAKGGNRHDTLASSAFSLATLIPGHLTEAQVVRALTDAASIFAVSKGERSFTDEEIESTISSAVSAGMSRPRTVPDGFKSRTHALAELDQVLYEWLQLPKAGWIGRRCSAVFPAVIKVAKELGGPIDVPLNLSRIATEANISRPTASKAIQDLRDLGWLTLRHSGSPGYSARYDIQIPRDIHLTGEGEGEQEALRSLAPLTHTDPQKWQGIENATDHDVSRPDALGLTGVRVWQLLMTMPDPWVTQAKVARLLGVDPGTVGRQVTPSSPLIVLGLVERDQKGRIRCGVDLNAETLDAAAADLGTLGFKDARRAAQAKRYMEAGLLSEDFHWVNPRDGSRGHIARWLAPPTGAEPQTAPPEEYGSTQ